MITQQCSLETDLDLALKFVMEHPQEFHHRQRFHTVFLRTKFYLPTLIDNPLPNEPFYPLRIYENNTPFFIVFDTLKKYKNWLKNSNEEEKKNISYEQIFGHELIDCLGNAVYLALNPGTKNYFELLPEHIQFLKKVIGKTKPPSIENDQ